MLAEILAVATKPLISDTPFNTHSTAFAEVSHLLIKIRLKVSFVPRLIHDVMVPGNIGTLSRRHILKVSLNLTLVEVLAVETQLALTPRMTESGIKVIGPSADAVLIKAE